MSHSSSTSVVDIPFKWNSFHYPAVQVINPAIKLELTSGINSLNAASVKQRHQLLANLILLGALGAGLIGFLFWFFYPNPKESFDLFGSYTENWTDINWGLRVSLLFVFLVVIALTCGLYRYLKRKFWGDIHVWISRQQKNSQLMWRVKHYGWWRGDQLQATMTNENYANSSFVTSIGIFA